MTAMNAPTAALGSLRSGAAFGANASSAITLCLSKDRDSPLRLPAIQPGRSFNPFKINTYTAPSHLLILNDLRNR